jgi:hypothetical protein
MYIVSRTVRVVALATPLLLVVGCASTDPGQLRTQTSDPRPVDPRADNEPVLKGLTPGLVVTLEIDHDRVSVAHAHVLMIPQVTSRTQPGELITLTGTSQGRVVSSVDVPDQRLNVQEGQGLVILEKRTIAAALPLPARIDTLEVRLPGKPSQRLDVRDAIERFCTTHPQAPLCQPELR